MFLAINWGNALIVTFSGFSIVFGLLIILIYIMKLFGVLMATKKEEKSISAAAVETSSTEGLLTDAESAAVAMAIYQYCNAHDEESYVLTFEDSERPYRPWSSKIYGINKLNK